MAGSMPFHGDFHHYQRTVAPSKRLSRLLESILGSLDVCSGRRRRVEFSFSAAGRPSSAAADIEEPGSVRSFFKLYSCFCHDDSMMLKQNRIQLTSLKDEMLSATEVITKKYVLTPLLNGLKRNWLEICWWHRFLLDYLIRLFSEKLVKPICFGFCGSIEVGALGGSAAWAELRNQNSTRGNNHATSWACVALLIWHDLTIK